MQNSSGGILKRTEAGVLEADKEAWEANQRQGYIGVGWGSTELPRLALRQSQGRTPRQLGGGWNIGRLGALAGPLSAARLIERQEEKCHPCHALLKAWRAGGAPGGTCLFCLGHTARIRNSAARMRLLVALCAYNLAWPRSFFPFFLLSSSPRIPLR